MPVGAVRLIPFLAASVVIHTIVFVAAGRESRELNAAPTDKGHEVSIRLEAAAPQKATTKATKPPTDSAEAVKRKPPSYERLPEPKVARIESVAQPISESRRPIHGESEPAAETESTDRHAGRSKAAEHPVAEMIESEPAEQVAEADDAATGSATTSSKAQRAEAREAIVAELAKHFRYPRLAQRRGWEGKVVLTVRILPDGRLDDIRITRSSGRALLDRSARQALAGVKRLPQFSNRVGEHGLALEIPVIYRLESA